MAALQVNSDGYLAVDVKVPFRSSLGLALDYARDWDVSDAFREIYQNWKDAIIQSFNIGLADFHPREVSNTKEEIVIEIQRSVESSTNVPTLECLGYIRFKKERGNVEFANFGACIDQQCLTMGYTTKASDPRLAGIYGEGLKIAALVLTRNDYRMQIGSSSCNWKFGFKGRTRDFNCEVAPVGGDKIAKLKATYNTSRQAGEPRKHIANIWEDVSVSFWRVRKSGQPVTEEEFRGWTRVTLDLNCPDILLRTPAGSLILDDTFSGQLYLKGIRAPIRCGEETYRYGYDLVSDNLRNRDRRLVSYSSTEEAKAVALIWEHAIKQQENQVLPRYTELLREYPSAPDVSLADESITETTAKEIWATLMAEAVSTAAFYYPQGYESRDVSTIQTELKYEPKPLPLPLWRLLHKCGLVRSPLEEIYHRFQRSKVVSLPSTLFAQEMNRALSALLLAYPKGKQTEIRYVRCADSKTNLTYLKDQNLLLVHHKWLDFWSAHRGSPCEVSETSQKEIEEFFCEHLVEELFKRAIVAMHSSSELMDPRHSQPLQFALRQINQKIHDMPTEIQIIRGQGSLQVSWNDGYTRAFSKRFGSTVEYLVVLHSEACQGQMLRLVYENDQVRCNCPRRLVPQSLNCVLFENLDDKRRFPMVVRRKDGAIYGHPPAPVSPIITASGDLNTPGAGLLVEADETSSEYSDYSPNMWRPNQPGNTTDSESCHSEELLPREGRASERICIKPQAMLNPEHGDISDDLSLPETYAPWKPLEEGLRRVREHFQSMQPKAEEALPNVVYEPHKSHGKFTRDEYVEADFLGERCILYIHDILVPKDQLSSVPQLLATKYSPLSSCLPLYCTADTGQDRELLVHFTDYSRMGQRGDAEKIGIDEISARRTTTVDHVIDIRETIADYYCRYAIRRKRNSGTAFFTLFGRPVEALSSFTAPPAPSVLDFSPGDPEVSLAFASAGYRIDGAIGYSQNLHHIWKEQNPDAQVYESFEEWLKLTPLDRPSFQVAVISKGTFLPALWGNDYDPLVQCRRVAEHSHPDALFLAMHWAGLYHRTLSALDDTILALLGQKYSVYMNLGHLTDSTVGDSPPMFFLLALPSLTDPQWLEDMLNDISSEPISEEHESSVINEHTSGSEIIDWVQIRSGLPPSFVYRIATTTRSVYCRLSNSCVLVDHPHGRANKKRKIMDTGITDGTIV